MWIVQNIIKSVFSVALPPKKHRSDEQSESARRGELTKSPILSSGDKRALPLVKRSFTGESLRRALQTDRECQADACC